MFLEVENNCVVFIFTIQMAGTDGSFLSTGACNLEVPGSNYGGAG